MVALYSLGQPFIRPLWLDSSSIPSIACYSTSHSSFSCSNFSTAWLSLSIEGVRKWTTQFKRYFQSRRDLQWSLAFCPLCSGDKSNSDYHVSLQQWHPWVSFVYCILCKLNICPSRQNKNGDFFVPDFLQVYCIDLSARPAPNMILMNFVVSWMSSCENIAYVTDSNRKYGFLVVHQSKVQWKNRGKTIAAYGSPRRTRQLGDDLRRGKFGNRRVSYIPGHRLLCKINQERDCLLRVNQFSVSVS